MKLIKKLIKKIPENLLTIAWQVGYVIILIAFLFRDGRYNNPAINDFIRDVGLITAGPTLILLGLSLIKLKLDK